MKAILRCIRPAQETATLQDDKGDELQEEEEEEEEPRCACTVSFRKGRLQMVRHHNLGPNMIGRKKSPTR